MPIKNTGRLTPINDAASRRCALDELCLSAVYTPAGMPTISANAAARNDNSSVAGSRSFNNSDTLRDWRNDRPNSPEAALPAKRANCT